MAERSTDMHAPIDTGLPSPGPDAQAHSARVQAHIQAMIRSSNSSISFADFMRAALYAPGLGYYAAGSAKLGAAGDFVTAPEMSSFFGATLVDAFAPMSAEKVLELGAGSGALARDYLAASRAKRHAVQYGILDISTDLRDRQQAMLSGGTVSWLDALPEKIEGLVLANEVLDAVPCEIVRFHAGHYQQARVGVQRDAFAWLWRPLLDGPLLDAAKHRIPPLDGYTSEINLEAEALVATLAERLTDGALCFIDYGFPQREYYVPDRSGGTLACHYQHRVHFDPLRLAGLQDITAHADFTAMAEAAVDAGASVVCYATQAQFLLHAGLLTQFENSTFASEGERIKALAAIQKLLSPTEMGELFKVLIVGKGRAIAELDHLAGIDQSFRL